MSEPGVGHNSEADAPTPRLAKEVIKSIVERVETLNEQIGELRSDQKDIFVEAKSNGFDVRALRQIIRLRAEDANKRAEREAILETYMQALGMLA